MKSPTNESSWLILEEADSTQNVAAQLLLNSEETIPELIFAHDQKQGRGRFQREWHSAKGDSLTMSIIFKAYESHSKPWLIGMAVSLAVVQAVDGLVCWPNDIHLNNKKVGGILTELLPSSNNTKIPVIGVGINLNQLTFPEVIEHKATSLKNERGQTTDALQLAKSIVNRISELPEPNDWSTLKEIWSDFDDTRGKKYRLPTGEIANAISVGESGALICEVNGEEKTVLVGEAIFGEQLKR